MTNPIKGMVAVISNYGVGKTTFALECGYHPKDMIFINDDVKTTGFEGDFKRYVDLVQFSSGKGILDFHKATIEMIKELPESKVIIWDTWTQFQSSFPVYVKANPNEFRSANEYSAMGKIKAGEQYQDAYRYEGGVLSYLKSKCDLLILTFHVKQHYENNVAIPGKYRPAHDRAIEKYADLRIWLMPNPGSQVPAGLALKNISKREITKSGIRTNQVLPVRVPRCNWENILEYWKTPIGDRHPEPGEAPNEFELSLVSGSLTAEDKHMYELSLNAPKEIDEEELLEVAEPVKVEQPISEADQQVLDEGRAKWIEDIVKQPNFPAQGNPMEKVTFINSFFESKGLEFRPVKVAEIMSMTG